MHCMMYKIFKDSETDLLQNCGLILSFFKFCVLCLSAFFFNFSLILFFAKLLFSYNYLIIIEMEYTYISRILSFQKFFILHFKKLV